MPQAGRDSAQIKAGVGKRTDVRFGGPLAIGYDWRGPITLGQGSQPWAYSTLALPMYTPIGTGIPPKANFDRVGSSGVMWSKQGVSINTLGSPGNLTGQFVSQPLLNVDAPKSPFNLGAFEPGSFLIPTG